MQLLQKIDSISAVVEKIEAKLQVSGIASIGELSAAGPPTISIVDQHKQIINEALFAFYHSITDDLPDVPASDRWTTDPIYARRTSLPPSIVPACDMMLMFIKNVQRSPEMSRYRRIPANNANYRTLLLPAVGHKRVLRSVGFVLKGNAWEWQWLVDETNSTTPVTTTPTEDSILKKAVEVPTNKEDVILILSHVIEGLQQIRSNTFDLVYQPQSQQAIASAASSITCSSSSPSTPPPTAIDNSLANNSSSASSSTITSVDATNQVASTSEIVQETISQLASAPSSSSLPSSSDSVSSAQLSVDITESSETLSENLTNEQRPSVSEHRTPLSPELQEVLSKARAISVFSTSRGSLGVSSMATNSAAANLFAHNEVILSWSIDPIKYFSDLDVLFRFNIYRLCEKLASLHLQQLLLSKLLLVVLVIAVRKINFIMVSMMLIARCLTAVSMGKRATMMMMMMMCRNYYSLTAMTPYLLIVVTTRLSSLISFLQNNNTKILLRMDLNRNKARH